MRIWSDGVSASARVLEPDKQGEFKSIDGRTVGLLIGSHHLVEKDRHEDIEEDETVEKDEGDEEDRREKGRHLRNRRAHEGARGTSTWMRCPQAMPPGGGRRTRTRAAQAPAGALAPVKSTRVPWRVSDVRGAAVAGRRGRPAWRSRSRSVACASGEGSDAPTRAPETRGVSGTA